MTDIDYKNELVNEVRSHFRTFKEFQEYVQEILGNNWGMHPMDSDRSYWIHDKISGNHPRSIIGKFREVQRRIMKKHHNLQIEESFMNPKILNGIVWTFFDENFYVKELRNTKIIIDDPTIRYE